MNIGLLDYGVGNVGSLANMLKFINHSPVMSDSIDDITNNRIIFIPGVGTFDKAIEKLHKKNNIQKIYELKNNNKNIIIGVCLGMQILFNSSQEGKSPGLGLINNDILSFRDSGIKQVPHMGWNTIYEDNLPFSVKGYNRFYFCHSFYCPHNNNYDNSAKTTYKNIKFSSVVIKNNVVGIQFHPEKSGMNGANFLRDLIGIYS